MAATKTKCSPKLGATRPVLHMLTGGEDPINSGIYKGAPTEANNALAAANLRDGQAATVGMDGQNTPAAPTQSTGISTAQAGRDAMQASMNYRPMFDMTGGLQLKHGGALRTGKGGAVPGTGKGDKVPAKYEPGEFVVSNAMLAAQPGLREQLQQLRATVLAKQGMTPEQADAKAVAGDEIKAEVGYLQDEELQKRVAQIPTNGYGASPVGEKVEGSDFSRNVGNTLMAVPGISPALGAVSTMARAVPYVGKAIPYIGAGTGALASKAAPYAVPATGLGVLQSASSPSTVQPNPAAPQPNGVANPAKPVVPQQGAPNDQAAKDITPMLDNALRTGAEFDKTVMKPNDIYKTVGKNGNPIYSGYGDGTGTAGRMVDGMGAVRPTGGVISAQNNAAAARLAERYGQAPINDSQERLTGGGALSVVPGMSKETIAKTLTNPDGSQWTAQDNAVMAANIRDGVNPYRGTSRQAAMDEEANAPKRGDFGYNNYMRNKIAMRGQDIQAGATREANKMAKDKFGLEAIGLGFDNKQKQKLSDAIDAYDNAKTPEEQKAALQRVNALRGKDKEQGQVVQLPDIQNPDGSIVRQGQVVLMPDGRILNPGQQEQQKLPPGMVRQVGTSNGKPVYEDANGKRVISKG